MVLQWHQLTMAFSHVFYIIAGCVLFTKRKFVSVIFAILIVLWSMSYHICLWEIETNVDNTNVYICPQSTLFVFVLLSGDLMFSQIGPSYFFFELLPHRSPQQHGKLSLTLGVALVIVCINGLTGSYKMSSPDYDISLYLMLGVVTFCLFIYIYHLEIFLNGRKNKWKAFKKYYNQRFQTNLLIIGLIFLVIGVAIWAIFQRLFPAYYFDIHPLWHIITGIALIFYALAIYTDAQYFANLKTSKKWSDYYKL